MAPFDRERRQAVSKFLDRAMVLDGAERAERLEALRAERRDRRFKLHLQHQDQIKSNYVTFSTWPCELRVTFDFRLHQGPNRGNSSRALGLGGKMAHFGLPVAVEHSAGP